MTNYVTNTPTSLRVLKAIELEAQKRGIELSKPHSAEKKGLDYYLDKPIEFIEQCINWPENQRPAPYQREILTRLVERKRVCVRSPHGAGKTAATAWAILWFALTRDGRSDWKVVCTASAWRQLVHYLMPEVHIWARRLRWSKIGRGPFTSDELLTLRLKLSTGEAFAVASDDPSYIEGAHATSLLYAFDESKAIPDRTFDAAEGAFAGAGADTAAEAYALAISTPGEPIGRFYDIQARRPGYDDWWVRHITLEEAIKAGRVSCEWAEQRARQWGETSAVYLNRVKGEFASSEEDGVIALSWIEAANERWREWHDAGRPLPVDTDTKQIVPMDTVGVDVARYGEDQTVFALRYGDIITELRAYAKADTMQTTGRVAGVLKGKGGTAVVDVIGIGAGVFDRLREQEHKVRAFNAANRSQRRDSSGELGFTNLRSEAWWNLREILSDPESEVALPPDDTLIGDLTAPRWKEMSGGKIQLESKDAIKKRIGRSTNYGDAVVQAFWKPTGVFIV